MKFWTRFQSPLKKFLTPKRPFKLTKGGWVFILYTIGVGAGAINTGNNLLYMVFGLFLGFIMASGVLSDTDLWRVDIDWHFPEAGEARKPCSIPISITNKKKWLPSLSITVSLEGNLEGKELNPGLFVPSILSRENLLRETTFVPPRRGYFQLERIRLYTKFPFGLLRKQWTLRGERREGFYIYPTLLPFSDADFSAFMAGNEERASSERRGEGSLVSGLREFVPTDSAKRIHWKASAKHAEWLVRETDLDEKRSVELCWPAWSDLKNMAEIEEFIEFTASFLWGIEQRGQSADLFVDGGVRVREPLKYLSIVDISAPLEERAKSFLETASNQNSFSTERIDALEAYQKWKK